MNVFTQPLRFGKTAATNEATETITSSSTREPVKKSGGLYDLMNRKQKSGGLYDLMNRKQKRAALREFRAVQVAKKRWLCEKRHNGAGKHMTERRSGR